MINRRVKRPSRAVENLQQLCLNSSGGVDCTKPHNDVKSVYMAKNLVNNTDGSLSLRKPIVLRQQYRKECVKVFQTGVDDVAAYVYRASKSRTSFHLGFHYPGIPYQLVWTDYNGTEHSVLCGKDSAQSISYLYNDVI